MRRALVIAAVMAFAPVAGDAAGTDLHAYWDARCRSCHGESGAFARRTLRVVDGRLLGAHHGADLERFLRQHYLADDHVAPVMAMLAAQAATAPLYRQHCAGCHGSAAAFARQSLARRDGVLVGKAGGRPVETLLRRHGGLAPDQVAEVSKTLARVFEEVGAPP